jgi:hypothetical protein
MAFLSKSAMSSGGLNIRTQLEQAGYTELQARLRNVAPKVQQRLFKSAVKPALSKMQADAKSRVLSLAVTVPTNKVRRAIANKIAIRTSGRMGSRFKTLGKLAVFYGRSATERPKELRSPAQQATLAHLIEYGFKLTHLFGRRIRTRRIPEKPFMRPAFEKNKASAEAAFVDAVRAGCEEAGI